MRLCRSHGHTVLVGTVVVAGCQQILGIEDGSGGGAPPVVNECGTDAFGNTAYCLEATPPGWSGPVVLTDGTASSACSAGWAEEAFDATEIVNAPAATCDCSCGESDGELCPDPIPTFSVSTNCTGLPGAALPDQMCSGAAQVAIISISMMPGSPTSGACPPTADHTVDPLGSLPREGCSAEPTLGSCDTSSTCYPGLPNTLEARYCIYAEGDLQGCPGSNYTERTTLYRGGINDTRRCTQCTCGVPTGASCSGESRAYANTDCTSLKGTIQHDGSCTVLSTVGFVALSVNATIVRGTCEKSGGTAQGSATGVDPITLCCTPLIVDN